MQVIDFRKNVFEITEEHPEVIEIMVELGFKDMGNAVVRKTAGKMMTIPMGCRMKGISLEEVVRELEKNGYVLKNN